MSAGLDSDDIARRLVDLADSAGPWDDPLPEVHRRAAAMTVESDSGSTGSSVFRSPRSAGRSRRWFRSVDPAKVATAAAVVTLVAGLGWLIHSGGADSGQKASGGQALASTAASAGAAAAGPQSAHGRTGLNSPSAAGCVWPSPTSAVSLRAPARVRSGAVVNVAVRLTGSAALDVSSPLVVVMREGRVVGRLVPTVIPPRPRLRPSAPTAVSTTLTGTLRRSTCAQATASSSGTPSARGLALPPGQYQLIAAAKAAGRTVVSAPVTVTVIR